MKYIKKSILIIAIIGLLFPAGFCIANDELKVVSLKLNETNKNGITAVLRATLKRADITKFHKITVQFDGPALEVVKSGSVGPHDPFYEDITSDEEFSISLDTVNNRISVLYKHFRLPRDNEFMGAVEIIRDDGLSTNPVVLEGYSVSSLALEPPLLNNAPVKLTFDATIVEASDIFAGATGQVNGTIIVGTNATPNDFSGVPYGGTLNVSGYPNTIVFSRTNSQVLSSDKCIVQARLGNDGVMTYFARFQTYPDTPFDDSEPDKLPPLDLLNNLTYEVVNIDVRNESGIVILRADIDAFSFDYFME